MTLRKYDAEIDRLRAEIVRVQRERVRASIEQKRIIDEESARRSQAKRLVAAE